jgi:Reverse transcriptase (RNA-dependent DNA polymerase)
MANGRIDPEVLHARTVFIPKCDRPQTPGEFRPIGITSVIIRQLHRIFAQRLRAFHGYDDRQKAFCNVDGTAENLLLLKAILDDSKRERRELHVVSVDIRKAFDSLSHSSIIETITGLGCPRPFVEYVKWVYDHATTNLHYGGHSQRAKVQNGVLQGDPLSPVVFNYLIDRALRTLNDNIGYPLQGKRINCIAFADDIILVSESKARRKKSSYPTNLHSR